MLILNRKPASVADRSAVAVYKDDLVVGHALFNLASKRDAFTKVVGDKVNRGAGYGDSISLSIQAGKMKELVNSLMAKRVVS